MLINQCHCYPSALCLSCKCIYTSTLWERQNEFLPLLTKFFTRLSHLHIVDSEQYDEDNIEYFGVFRFILEIVFGNREPALTHLEVECCETFMIKAMRDLANFVSFQSGTIAEFTHGSLTTQYSRLKVLSLAAWDDSEDEPEQISIQLVGVLTYDRSLSTKLPCVQFTSVVGSMTQSVVSMTSNQHSSGLILEKYHFAPPAVIY